MWLYVGNMKKKEWEAKSVGHEVERKAQHLSLQVPLRSHSSSSSSEENSSSSAAQPLLPGERGSPSSTAEDHLVQTEFLHGARREGGQVRWVFNECQTQCHRMITAWNCGRNISLSTIPDKFFLLLDIQILGCVLGMNSLSCEGWMLPLNYTTGIRSCPFACLSEYEIVRSHICIRKALWRR